MTDDEIDGLILDDRERKVFRVKRTALNSKRIFELERERIFASLWLYAAHESEIKNAGDYVQRTVGGRDIFLTRNKGGGINAFFNTCTHRGATICRHADGNATSFQCFYHAWTFDLEGQLIGMPGPEAYSDGFDRDELALSRVPRLESYRGFIFVSFNVEAGDLESYLAGARKYIDDVVDMFDGAVEVIRGSAQYTIKANWKLLAENSYDAYHAPTTHETYQKYIAKVEREAAEKYKGRQIPGAASVSRWTPGEALDLGNGHAITVKIGLWGRPIAMWTPTFGDEAIDEIEAIRQDLISKHGEKRGLELAEQSTNMVIFPNLVLNDIMAVTIRTFYPVSASEMRVSAWQLAPAHESPTMRAARLDNFLTFLGPGGFATPDDVEALESCQAGIEALDTAWSDISRGMANETPDRRDEHQMRTWWRRWYELMANRVRAGAR